MARATLTRVLVLGRAATAFELGNERRRRAHPGGQLGLGEPGGGTRLYDRSRDLQRRVKIVQGIGNAHALSRPWKGGADTGS